MSEVQVKTTTASFTSLSLALFLPTSDNLLQLFFSSLFISFFHVPSSLHHYSHTFSSLSSCQYLSLFHPSLSLSPFPCNIHCSSSFPSAITSLPYSIQPNKSLGPFGGLFQPFHLTSVHLFDDCK